MSSNLRSHLHELASNFAVSVLEALRGASLEEILAEAGGGAGNGRAVRGPRAAARGQGGGETSKARRRGGRLSRRSADDIAELVDRIVRLLGENQDGLRAEQIRDALGLEAKELPRPLAEALDQKRITKQGHKRATTYFASGRGSASGRESKRGAGRRKAAKKAAGAARGKKKGGRKRAASAPAAPASEASA